jgi:hypothetical protein
MPVGQERAAGRPGRDSGAPRRTEKRFRREPARRVGWASIVPPWAAPGRARIRAEGWTAVVRFRAVAP